MFPPHAANHHNGTFWSFATESDFADFIASSGLMAKWQTSESHILPAQIASEENCNESRCSGVGTATTSKTNAYPVT